MKILLVGADGQLGSQLRHTLAGVGELTALARGSVGAYSGDVTDESAMRRAVSALQPDAIVNAAAYTAVDRAEREPDAAFAVNARACETLARLADAAGAWLVHYSTDYVFDGSGTRAWRESDTPAPLNVYGRSKLEGEQAIRAHCARHVILRTSWVYEAGGDNFIGSILKAACARDSLSVVDDQWGTPTRARLLAQLTAQVLPRLDVGQAGLYHVAAAGETSRHALARYAIACAARRGWPLKTRPGDVQAVKTSQTGAAAARPLNSRLDCSLFERTFGLGLPGWHLGVEEAIEHWPPMAGS